MRLNERKLRIGLAVSAFKTDALPLGQAPKVAVKNPPLKE